MYNNQKKKKNNKPRSYGIRKMQSENVIIIAFIIIFFRVVGAVDFIEIKNIISHTYTHRRVELKIIYYIKLLNIM